MSRSTEEKLKMADLVLRVNLDFEIFDFSAPKEVISGGEKAAERELFKVNKLLLAERSLYEKIFTRLGINEKALFTHR